MNRRQKLVQQQFLNNEQTVVKRLEYIYDGALSDINKKIRGLEFQIGDLQEEYDWMDDDDPKKEIIRSRIQSKIYQKQYQEQLQKQIDGVLKEMQTKQFLTVSDYLDTCYEDGFIGSIFDLHGQDVPLMIPLDQTKMVRAIQLDSKISKGLYTKLGEDVTTLKKRITSEVTRSIATGTSYSQCAKRLAGQTKIGYNKAVRIARTEGHRIQCTAADDVAHEARDAGADVMKQWDATLDGLTRESHQAVDGEIRELDKPFSNGLMFPSDPAGAAAEVINCRCAYLQRARWALEGEFTKWNSFTDQLETFESPQAYDEFKKSFWCDENTQYMRYVQEKQDKYGTKDMPELLEQMTDREYKHYSRLLASNPVYNKNASLNSKIINLDSGMSADEIDKIGRHNLYNHWEEYRQKFLGNASPVDFDSLDSNFMYDTVKLGKYKDKEVVEEIFTQVDNLSAQFYSPLQKISWMDKMESAFGNSFANSNHGWGYGFAEIRFNPTKLTSDGIERIFELSQKGYSIKFPKGKEIDYLVTHEFGHCILNIGEALPSKSMNFVQCDFSAVKKARKEIDLIWQSYSSKVEELTETYKAISKPLDSRLIFEGLPPTDAERKMLSDAKKNLDSVMISKYSMTTEDEFLAEAFADAVLGENPSEYSMQVYDVILKYFGKG